MRRHGVLAAAALAAAALAAPAGAVPSPAQLLARYQPVTVLERAEAFRPIAVEPFVAASDLESRTASGGWEVVAPGATLPTRDPPGCTAGPTPCWRLNVRACSASAGLPSVACYADADTAGGGRSAVYARHVRSGDRIVLQYWYFYSYNFWSALYPQSAFIWRSHEADWELVSVILDRAQKPLVAAYSAHCNGSRRPWAKVRKWRATHPIAYVALGSHANYFAPGVHRHERRCWPQAAHVVFEANPARRAPATRPPRSSRSPRAGRSGWRSRARGARRGTSGRPASRRSRSASARAARATTRSGASRSPCSPGARGDGQPSSDPIARAAWRRNATPSSRSSTWMRSSAEWTSSDATSGSIARIGKKP